MQAQGGLPLVGQVTRPRLKVPDSHVALCATEAAAYRMCFDKAQPRMTYEAVAKQLTKQGVKMTRDRLCKLFNADKSETPARGWRVFQIELQRVCNNRVIDQWADLYERGMLNCQRDEAELALEQALEEANAHVAALKAQLGAA